MKCFVNTGAMLSWLAVAILLGGAWMQPARAGGDDPYPEFVAGYDVMLNGIKVGSAKFSLSHLRGNEYLYRSEAARTGVAGLFGAKPAQESSRWRLTENGIEVLEYRARHPGGDDDDNSHLLFDHEKLRVANRGAGEQWDIAMPEGTLDSMVMQLAMLFDLRDGKQVFEYPVAVRGRIKHYRFERAGEDTTELPLGSYRTLKLERKDDDRDKSWIWSAPELNYFPVRFIKQKSSGLKTEILLRELRFLPPAQ
ncbi:MAG: DUF3108 domain-containing protein [Thiogranum sp.]|nr:DUF3108 domain-containing protein [Thiogranum sp.]